MLPWYSYVGRFCIAHHPTRFSVIDVDFEVLTHGDLLCTAGTIQARIPVVRLHFDWRYGSDSMFLCMRRDPTDGVWLHSFISTSSSALYEYQSLEGRLGCIPSIGNGIHVKYTTLAGSSMDPSWRYS